MATKAKKTVKKTVAKKTAAPKANGTAHKKAKSELIAALIRRTNGCTREEVLKLTGWASVSMQAQAKAAGIKLRIDKATRPFRYRTSGD